jgi:hypothetical protein
MKINEASWLKPGWIFAARIDGGFYLTEIKIARADTKLFADAVINVLDDLRQKGDASGFFVAQDDCALVSEYHPDAFKRTQK